MANFARIDKNNIVQHVSVVENKNILNEHGQEEEDFGIAYLNKVHGVGFTWVQTSFSGKFRKNFAGFGFNYDKERDAFISPKLYNSWILSEDTCQWEPPVAYPNDDKEYKWNESNKTWDYIPKPDIVVY